MNLITFKCPKTRVMKERMAKLAPESTYHIYNRSMGDERMFRSPENYRFFMQRYIKYIDPVCKTLCYCLMPNHFHVLVRTRTEKEICSILKSRQDEDFSVFVSHQFSKFFNSYSKAVNKMYNRKGSLFMRPYKRIPVTDSRYLLKLIHYIHFNPVVAGLCDCPEKWQFSSFGAMISDKPTRLEREIVLELFDDREGFMEWHRRVEG